MITKHPFDIWPITFFLYLWHIDFFTFLESARKMESFWCGHYLCTILFITGPLGSPLSLSSSVFWFDSTKTEGWEKKLSYGRVLYIKLNQNLTVFKATEKFSCVDQMEIAKSSKCWPCFPWRVLSEYFVDNFFSMPSRYDFFPSVVKTSKNGIFLM